MSTDVRDQLIVGVYENIAPASWRELVASEGRPSAVRALIDEAATDAEHDTLVLYQEFAIHVSVEGDRHVLGLFAELDAPPWVDAQFALDLLRAVHEQIAPDACCNCVSTALIIIKPTRCN